MAFISKFNGSGRILGIHKPAAPLTPTVSNTATTSTTLTFNITNYIASWIYTATISPSGGTITFNGSQISITGLNSSTAYTLTVTARNSGGSSVGSGSATTGAPPPFFPPFFPGFGPFFPFFPPPFFPPAFRVPPPRPPPNFPPSKTAPTTSLRNLEKISLLTEEYGYLEDKYLTEDDILVSVELDEKNNVLRTSSTRISNIDIYPELYKFVYINDELYPENAKLLVRKNGVSEFKKSIEIDKDYEIYNFEKKEFVSVIEVIVRDDVKENIFVINTEPNKHYIIQSSIGYFYNL